MVKVKRKEWPAECSTFCDLLVCFDGLASPKVTSNKINGDINFTGKYEGQITKLETLQLTDIIPALGIRFF